MANNITDTGDIVLPINAMFTRRFLERAEYQTQYFAGTDPAMVARHGGTATALWRRFEHFTPDTTPLTALTTDALPTRAPQTPSIFDVNKAVAKYGKHVTLNEEVDVFNFNGSTAEITDALAVQAGRTFNMVARNEFEDNSTAIYAGGAASTGAVTSAITLLAINTALLALQTNVAKTFNAMTMGSQNIGTVPILRSYYCVTHPYVGYDIAGLSGFTSVEKYASQVQVMPDEIGYLGRAGLGIRVCVTPDASTDAGSGGSVASTGLRSTSGQVDIFNTVIWGQNAVGTLALDAQIPMSVMNAKNVESMDNLKLIFKEFGSSGVSDPLDELSSLGWKGWGAAKILNGNWVRRIVSGATLVS